MHSPSSTLVIDESEEIESCATLNVNLADVVEHERVPRRKIEFVERTSAPMGIEDPRFGFIGRCKEHNSWKPTPNHPRCRQLTVRDLAYEPDIACDSMHELPDSNIPSIYHLVSTMFCFMIDSFHLIPKFIGDSQFFAFGQTVLEYDFIKFCKSVYARNRKPRPQFWFRPLLYDAIELWIQNCNTAHKAVFDKFRPFCFNPNDDLVDFYNSNNDSKIGAALIRFKRDFCQALNTTN
jgi:hypothetical protein